jgi:predicted ester cyclase
MTVWSGWQLMERLMQQPDQRFQDDLLLIDHAQAQVFRGWATIQSHLRAVIDVGFPNAQIDIRTMLEDGHYTVVECTFRGSQWGPFMGITATGRPVAVPLVLVCQRCAGKIGRISLYYDAGALLRQLGLAP